MHRLHRRQENGRQGQAEAAAVAGLACGRHAAAQHLGEALGQRQAEAGASEQARRRAVGLLEALEQLGQLLLGHADPGVGDLEEQVLRPVRAALPGPPTG